MPKLEYIQTYVRLKDVGALHIFFPPHASARYEAWRFRRHDTNNTGRRTGKHSADIGEASGHIRHNR